MGHDLGLMVGTGLMRLGLDVVARRPLKTPYGPPSSPILTVAVGALQLPLIARHGESHSIAPHEVNYRANVWALAQAGVRRCVSINTVGAIAATLLPGELAVPDQLIDYTWGRAQTFGGEQPQHIDFTLPFDPLLAAAIADTAVACGYGIATGTYGVTQGPRLESAAEIDRLERDGCAMVGMTAMPEAALARELGIAYAICAVAVNHAAGRAVDGAAIHGQMERHLAGGMARARDVLARLLPVLGASATL
jgi:5'-methylthioinosine phosphorylase